MMFTRTMVARLNVRPEMKQAISIGYRRPRESGGPEQPFEPCGPWVPAFAGMTDKRLILQKSLWFEFSEYSQSRATTFIVSPKFSGTVADDLCAAATVSCTARVAANAGPRRTHQPRGRTLPYDVVGNAGGTRRSSADRIWPVSISCAGARSKGRTCEELAGI